MARSARPESAAGKAIGRPTGRRLAVDIDPTSTASRADPQDLARTIDRTLTTSVRPAGPLGRAPVTRLRHLNLQQIAAIEISGGPMQVVNQLSGAGAVFVYTVVAGDCSIRCEAGQATLGPGRFVLLRGGRTVQATHAADYLVRSVRLPAAQLAAELPGWAAAELLPVDADSGPGRPVFALQEGLLAFGADLSPRGADACARALACLLADALRSVLPHADDAAASQAEHHKRRIRAHVRQHLSDPALDVARIAAGVALSVGHLHRLFADEPLSLAAWIQAERLDACRDALLGGGNSAGRSLTELALSWGFRDPAHFSRSFKRRFGETPSALRARGAGTDASAGASAEATPPR